MCLYIKHDLHNDTLKQLDTQEYIVYYKIVRVEDKQFVRSLYYNTHSWAVGANVSNRLEKQLTADEACNMIVDNGIHVYLDKNKAEINLKILSRNNVLVIDACSLSILEVQCKKQDFVTAGITSSDGQSAVFNQVEVTQEALDKCIKEAVKIPAPISMLRY